MSREIWSGEDELGFQIGDMHGEWQTEESKEASGGGQGKGKKPVTKIQGTQHRQKVEKQVVKVRIQQNPPNKH
jgi:hypothetical protein